MYLNDVKKGARFFLQETQFTYPFIALEDAHLEAGLNGDDYWVANCINLTSGITIPLSVHIAYPHYLRLIPEAELHKPCMGLEWNSHECHGCS